MKFIIIKMCVHGKSMQVSQAVLLEPQKVNLSNVIEKKYIYALTVRYPAAGGSSYNPSSAMAGVEVGVESYMSFTKLLTVTVLLAAMSNVPRRTWHVQN